jgi:Flp pilus assembly protein TadB
VRWALAWLLLGAAAAFLLAAVISVALGGPGWPIFLTMGAAAIGASLVTTLRNRRQDDAQD